MSYLQRSARTYISKTRESAFNDSNTTGANYLRAISDTPLVTIPNIEWRDDQGRSGSEFASSLCPTYWTSPGLALSTDVDFDLVGRLWLRAAGGTVTDSTVVSLLAGKHSAPMLDAASSLQLPSFNFITVVEGSGASFRYTGAVVDQATLSRTGIETAKASFNILGSGKHYAPHGVTSLPSAPSFSCLRPFGYLSYDDGSPVDLGADCDLRDWTITLNNNHNAANDRCNADSTQYGGDPTDTTTDLQAAYNSRLLHGDRTVTAQVTVLIPATTLAQWDDMINGTDLTNFTFGARGADLDPGGTPATTYEFIKIIIPTSRFRQIVNVDNNGKAAIQCDLQPLTSGSSLITVEVQNSTIGNTFR